MKLACLAAAAWASVARAGDGTCAPCSPGAAPAPGDEPTSLNGVRWPTLCIDDGGADESHFFTIGDWGGMGPSYPPKTFDNTQEKRPFVEGLDDHAQTNVAAVMKDVAKKSHPEFLLNVGDNFYPGGYETNCGQTNMCNVIHTGQWTTVFERVYDGPDLLKAVWMGVLGNHDYGGHHFNKGWDQSVAYTWHSDRWLTPALYWERRVQYCNFSVDIYFVDSNFNDVWPTHHDPDHNICSNAHNMVSNCKSCGGPTSAEDCTEWFKKLERDQKAWLEERLARSDADWQVVVTHFPPQWQAPFWERLAATHGVDLIVSGHRHQQEVHYKDGVLKGMGDTAWVVTGGGGGVTSEGNPKYEGPLLQQYGFMDIAISREALTIDMWSHTGKKMSSTVVTPRPRMASPPQMLDPASNGSAVAIPRGFDPFGGNGSDAAAACALHPGCAGLAGQCCPNLGGVFLSCCEAAEPDGASEEQPVPETGEVTTMVRKLSQCGASRRRGTAGALSSGSRRRIMHYSLNCWSECGHAGYCGFCGEGNACCRYGATDDPVECEGVFFPVRTWHTCVQPLGGRLVELGAAPALVLGNVDTAMGGDISTAEPQDLEINYLDDSSLDMQVDLMREDCFQPCGAKAGMCDFYCGAGRACCKKHASPGDPDECRRANVYGFLTDHYECVMVMSGHPAGDGSWGTSRNETVAPAAASLAAAGAGSGAPAPFQAGPATPDEWPGSLSVSLWHGFIGCLSLGTAIVCASFVVIVLLCGWIVSNLVTNSVGKERTRRSVTLESTSAGQLYEATPAHEDVEEATAAPPRHPLAGGAFLPASAPYRIATGAAVPRPVAAPGAWAGAAVAQRARLAPQAGTLANNINVVRRGEPVVPPPSGYN